MGLDFFNSNTVTLYNRHTDKLTGREMWFPTLLSNVNLEMTKGAYINKSGTQDADSVKLFVNADNMPKPYVESVKWKNLDDEIKSEYMTFTGSEDFFVEGDTLDVKIIDEGFFEWMRKHYDNVFKVTNIDRYRDILPHFEVGGK